MDNNESETIKKSDIAILFNEYPHLKEVFVKVLIAYERERWNMRDKYCAMCFKKLTPTELSFRSPTDFNFCCTEHAEYRKVFNLSIVRKQLGIPERRELINLLKELS